MRLVHCSALGNAGSVRRLELVATENTAIFGATSAHQWITYCDDDAPRLRQLRQVRRYLSAYPRRDSPGAGFHMLNIMCRALVATERIRRNRAASNGRADMPSAVYCRKLFARKVQWAHCVNKRHLYCTAQTANLRLRQNFDTT